MKRSPLPARDYLIGLGSNHQAEQWLPWALTRLDELFAPLRHSQPAYSRDARPSPEPALSRTYLNAAAVLRCDWPTWRLQRLLKSLETQAGRSPALKAAGWVLLDLDLLGRRCDDHPWRSWPRRQRDLTAAYMTPHLQQVLDAPALARLLAAG